MSKPTDTGRWAATSPGVITGDPITPSSDKATIGFVTRERPPNQLLDYLFYTSFIWHEYLSDGAFEGASSFDSDLDVGGELTVGGLTLVVADFTYTADNTTDTLTATAHVLQTGDGPLRTTNSGGGLPGGLAVGTDYFAIRTGANTFKLATTRANALLGTAIDITTNGTGTQTIIDQPGTTRVTDATVTRNLIVAGSISHGQSPVMVPATAARGFGTGATPAGGGGGGGAGVWRLSVAADVAQFPITLPVGDRIVELDTWYARANDSAEFTIKLFRVPMSTGTETTIASATINGTGGVPPEKNTLSPGHTILVDNTYYVEVEFTTGSFVDLFGVGIRRDHPAV